MQKTNNETETSPVTSNEFPVLHQEDVLPPMMQTKQNTADSASPNINSGSGAPTNDTIRDTTIPATVTSSSKKKIVIGKVISTILGLLLLVGLAGAGIYMVQQNQSNKDQVKKVPAAPTAQCQNIKAYSPTWVLLSSTQLSALTTGSKVNLCATGYATEGSFDKAIFTINNVVQSETTLVRPTSNDFCQPYTIPAETTTFNITAQIHHITLGWK